MKLIPILSPRFLAAEALTVMPDWGQIFGNAHPLVLEIGCGIGDFVAEMAGTHPVINFIAIDFYNKGCLKTVRRADKGGLDNVRVIRDEARSFIERCILPESLQGVIINCPDPWPKMRHRKRRLVNIDFVRWLSNYMKPGADFSFATDFEDYGEDVARFMPNVECFENMFFPDICRHERNGYPLSKYMRKFIAEGKQIYFVHYRKLS